MDFSAWLVSFIIPLGIASITIINYLLGKEEDRDEN